MPGRRYVFGMGIERICRIKEDQTKLFQSDKRIPFYQNESENDSVEYLGREEKNTSRTIICCC